MNWSKTVLIFQAMTTFVIATILLTQLVFISNAGPSDLNPARESQILSIKILDLKIRYTLASYILFIVSLAELIVIFRHIR